MHILRQCHNPGQYKAALFTKKAQGKDIYVNLLEKFMVLYLWRHFSDVHSEIKTDVSEGTRANMKWNEMK